VELGSLFTSESQLGPILVHRTRQGLIPPLASIKSEPGGFNRLSRVIPIEKTLMARCQPTRRGMKETSRLGPRYQACGCRVLSMGPQKVPDAGHPFCVALSLALFAMGGADPTGGFCLRTLSFAGPSAIMGPVWDMIVISYAIIAGAMCED
jgi:hypothetical protein